MFDRGGSYLARSKDDQNFYTTHEDTYMRLSWTVLTFYQANVYCPFSANVLNESMLTHSRLYSHGLTYINSEENSHFDSSKCIGGIICKLCFLPKLFGCHRGYEVNVYDRQNILYRLWMYLKSPTNGCLWCESASLMLGMGICSIHWYLQLN